VLRATELVNMGSGKYQNRSEVQPCANCQTVAEIWPFFDFLRWRPSVILDLFYACLEQLTVVLIVVQNLVGMGNVYSKIFKFQCYASLAYK